MYSYLLDSATDAKRIQFVCEPQSNYRSMPTSRPLPYSLLASHHSVEINDDPINYAMTLHYYLLRKQDIRSQLYLDTIDNLHYMTPKIIPHKETSASENHSSL